MRSTPEEEPDMGKDTVTVDRKLYAAADGTIVEAGDPRAASVYATPGQEIPRAEAERLGITPAPAEEPAAPEPELQADEEPEAKQQPKPADKQRRSQANKGA
jgi:hypothetical protein